MVSVLTSASWVLPYHGQRSHAKGSKDRGQRSAGRRSQVTDDTMSAGQGKEAGKEEKWAYNEFNLY